VLGDMAKVAVPELVKMYDEDLSADSRKAQIRCVGLDRPASSPHPFAPAIRDQFRSAAVRANACGAG